MKWHRAYMIPFATELAVEEIMKLTGLSCKQVGSRVTILRTNAQEDLSSVPKSYHKVVITRQMVLDLAEACGILTRLLKYHVLRDIINKYPDIMLRLIRRVIGDSGETYYLSVWYAKLFLEEIQMTEGLE